MTRLMLGLCFWRWRSNPHIPL